MKFLMRPEERAFARTMTRLTSCNHFLPERIDLEREALGSAFAEGPTATWNLNFDSNVKSLNILRLTEKTAALVDSVHQRLIRGGRLNVEELDGYIDLVSYHLYQVYRKDFEALTSSHGSMSGPLRCYDAFSRDVVRYLQPARQAAPPCLEVARLFAGLWQIERAFINIFTNIVGSSAAIAKLRASVWQSIFTCDIKRYRQGLYERMHEITTLITGPSGTGKELVAKAIASSAYIPFDPEKRQFAVDHRELFLALNLSALSSNLLESELFGHKRGAFTGALQDHAGWLQACPARGSVFLDEIGEISGGLQVKLLRVLETRTFHRLGESNSQSFGGKIIAATNRNLGQETQAGRFREDFYYRLCSDVVVTPSLREQLAEAPEDLPRLVRFIARRFLTAELSDELADEVGQFVARRLGREYSWPGNFRELEQCVRNILVRRSYEPIQLKPDDPAVALAASIENGRLTAEELLQHYCSIVYARTHNLEETARRLQLDRRTVKAKLQKAEIDNTDALTSSHPIREGGWC